MGRGARVEAGRWSSVPLCGHGQCAVSRGRGRPDRWLTEDGVCRAGMDKFVTRTKRTNVRTDLPKELPSLGKSSARPWKGAMSPKTPSGGKRKEPEGPTMYVTAAKAYINEHKDEYKKKHPEKEGKDINKELKAEYEALSDEVKKPYEDAAEKDKQRYNEEMKAVRDDVQRRGP